MAETFAGTAMLVMIFLFFPTLSSAEETELTLAIPPGMDAMHTQQAYGPLAAYLTQKLQRQVVLHAPAQFETFWQGVADSRYDLVHYNAYLYVNSHEAYGYDVVLKNTTLNSIDATSVIAVRKASGIRHIQDIKGRPILFGGGPKAMLGYIVPRYLLATEGLLPGSYQENFLPEAQAEGALVDAVISPDKAQVMATWSNRIDPRVWRVLLVSEPMAVQPWAVKHGMPAELAGRIQNAMMELNTSEHGMALLRAARINGLARAEDIEFDAHRAMIAQVSKP